jgi:hypothetical protein
VRGRPPLAGLAPRKGRPAPFSPPPATRPAAVLLRPEVLAVARDAALLTEGFGEGLAQNDAQVLHQVVVVDVGVAGGFHVQVEIAVFGEEFQHVVQKRQSGFDPVTARAVQVQPHPDLRLGGVARSLRCALAHGTLLASLGSEAPVERLTPLKTTAPAEIPRGAPSLPAPPAAPWRGRFSAPPHATGR